MELVIETIKLAREFEDRRFLKTFYHEYLKEEIQPVRILYLFTV